MPDANIAPFFATLRAANPMPVTELEYTSVFELLAAVLLSAQATDVSVNKATRRLFPVANTPARMLALGQDALEGHIKTIGLYRSKARHLMQTCRILMERHGGQVPSAREDLEALAGVGRKTANVVLANAFGVPALAVDTHVGRLARRLGLSVHEDPDRVEEDLCALWPKESWVPAHHALKNKKRQTLNDSSNAFFPRSFLLGIFIILDITERDMKDVIHAARKI